MTTHWFTQLGTGLRRRQTCRRLLRLDDRLLADIGQDRAALERALKQPLLRKRVAKPAL